MDSVIMVPLFVTVFAFCQLLCVVDVVHVVLSIDGEVFSLQTGAM
jgi:hypothetical protein